MFPWGPWTVIAYQGGGYEGCFWEWNYALIRDSFGGPEDLFVDLYSSGKDGCHNLQDLLNRHRYWVQRQDSQDDKFSAYNLLDPEDRLLFVKREPLHRVFDVARVLDSANVPFRLAMSCEECGDEFDPGYEPYRDHWESHGGIQHDSNVVCASCSSCYSCHYCGEFVGSANMNEESGYCTWCHDRHWKEDQAHAEQNG